MPAHILARPQGALPAAWLLVLSILLVPYLAMARPPAQPQAMAPAMSPLLTPDRKTGPVREYRLTIRQEPVNVTGHPVPAMTINHGIPGPALTFREGDTARIHVTNAMEVPTSIHWHGILVPPGMDGVPNISFPPIAPGATFTYEFPIRQSGTYWYHSHSGLQEQRGVYGAIVIHPASGMAMPRAEGEAVVVLSDWTDRPPASVMHDLRRGSEFFALQKGSSQSVLGAAKAGRLGDYLGRELSRMPAMDISDVAYDRFLANGRPGIHLAGQPGQTLRLRIIDGSATTFFHLTYAAGPMTIVAADGIDVEPVEVERLLIGVAETYDLLVTLPASGQAELRATAHDGSAYASIWLGSGQALAAPAVPRPDLYRNMHAPSLGQVLALTPAGAMGMTDAEVEAGSFDQPGMMGGMDHGGHDMGGMKMEDAGHHGQAMSMGQPAKPGAAPSGHDMAMPAKPGARGGHEMRAVQPAPMHQGHAAGGSMNAPPSHEGHAMGAPAPTRHTGVHVPGPDRSPDNQPGHAMAMPSAAAPPSHAGHGGAPPLPAIQAGRMTTAPATPPLDVPPAQDGVRYTWRFAPLATDVADSSSVAMDGGPERPWPPYAKLRATRPTAPDPDAPRRTIRLTLDGDMERYVWMLNNKTLSEDVNILIKKGEVVRFVMINRTMMHHPMHLHGHFFRVINGQGDRSPLKHTVDVAPMSTTVIEFLADEFGDWFFHCHLLYHMKGGMARLVHYDGFPPPPGVAPIRHRLYADSWYAFARAELLSNMTEGMVTASSTRHIFTGEWEAGWQRQEETTWELLGTYGFWVNRFLTPFIGVHSEGEKATAEKTRGVAGLAYLLPFNLDARAWVDSDAGWRVELEREIMITPRVEAHLEWRYDSHEFWEAAVGVSYRLTSNLALTAKWHSDYAWGAGITLAF